MLSIHSRPENIIVNIRCTWFQTLSCAKRFPLLLEGVNVSLQLSVRAQQEDIATATLR